jgi:hypothetical protein
MINNTDVLCICADDSKVPTHFIRKSHVDAIVAWPKHVADKPDACMIYVGGIGFDVGMAAEKLACIVFSDDVIANIKKQAQKQWQSDPVGSESNAQ